MQREARQHLSNAASSPLQRIVELFRVKLDEGGWSGGIGDLRDDGKMLREIGSDPHVHADRAEWGVVANAEPGCDGAGREGEAGEPPLAQQGSIHENGAAE